MTEMKIRLSNDNLIKKLDELAEKENFSSRNKLIEHILTQYVTYNDKLFLDNLPPIISHMCKQAIKETTEKNELLIRANINILDKIEKDLEALRTVFYGDLPSDYTQYQE